MYRCWALVRIGLGVIAFRKWIASDQSSYLHRTYRDTESHQAYLKLFGDQGAARFVILVAGSGVILVGLTFLAARH